MGYPSGNAIGYSHTQPGIIAEEFRQEMISFNHLIELGDRSSVTVFSKCPSLNVWILIMIIGLTVAPVLIFESIETLKKILRVFSYPGKVLFWFIPATILVLIFLVFLPQLFISIYSIPIQPPIQEFNFKLGIVLTINGLASAMAIVVILITGNIAYNLRKQLVNEDSINRYYVLHQLQMRFLFLIGLLVSLGSVATFLMHKMHLEVFGEHQPFINEQSVASEGMFYTFILAIFFIPARRELHRFGQRIIDREFGLRPPDGTNWQTWMAEREAMETSLGLKTDWKERLKWAIPVFAPLVSSILPEQLFG